MTVTADRTVPLSDFAAATPASKASAPYLWVPSGYFAMGLTYAVLTGIVSIMFKNLGLSNGEAAAYSSVLIASYTIKPFFASVVEVYRTKRFFVVLSQVVLALGFVLVAIVMSFSTLTVILVMTLLAISIFGAVQDIATDGVYITSLDARTQPLYAGVQSFSWYGAFVVAYGGLIWLSGALHERLLRGGGVSSIAAWLGAWRTIFLIVAVITAVLALWHRYRMPTGSAAPVRSISATSVATVSADSFRTFFQKTNIWRMIAFAFFFQTSTGLLEKVGPLFMVDAKVNGGLALSNEQLGLTYGTFGLMAVLFGSLIGGFFIARTGVKRALLPMCYALNIPGVIFLIFAFHPNVSLAWVAIGVCIEKFFYGFGLVALTMYVMQQISPGKYMTAHFAFGTAIKGLAVMLTGIASGYLQESVGYKLYFVIVMLAMIPSLLATIAAPFDHDEDKTDDVIGQTPVPGAKDGLLS